MNAIFYLTALAMFIACLTHANAMNGHTRAQMKIALWVLMAGDVAQVMACAYDHMTVYGVAAATVVSAAITLWLAFERRLDRVDI
jgi:hypothetical protein